MNLLLKIISANDKWDGFTIVITTNVISNTHKYVICIYIWLIQITHTTTEYSELYSEKVWKIILSCSLSCKRVHYQCLPKSLCLCSKRLSLLCFKRIISCPYKSTIILPLLKRLLPPRLKMRVLPNYFTKWLVYFDLEF